MTVENNTASVLQRKGLSLTAPTALAIDYAGNLIVALAGNKSGSVLVIPPAGKFYLLGPPSSLLAPAGAHGLAVDDQGNLFISDTGNDQILGYPAGSSGTFVVSTGTLTLSSPSGLALDRAGNLFIADTGNNRIVELAANGTASVVPTGTPDLNAPTGVAIDPAGTLYISQASNNSVVEVSPGGLQTALINSGLSNPAGIALDHAGNVYIADTGNKRVVELDRPMSPTESFNSTKAGTVSSDSPKTVVIRNIGVSAFTVSSVTYPPDFPEDASGKETDCRAGLAVAAGGTCTLTIDSKPVAAVTKGSSTLLKENVKVTSNTLNKPGTVQTVVVEGTELK